MFIIRGRVEGTAILSVPAILRIDKARLLRLRESKKRDLGLRIAVSAPPRALFFFFHLWFLADSISLLRSNCSTKCLSNALPCLRIPQPHLPVRPPRLRPNKSPPFLFFPDADPGGGDPVLCWVRRALRGRGIGARFVRFLGS
ncbi:hypothetical protein CDL15_Pgr011984 [Punica granatum]|uniref:Uncharacterized protein n=1 Tax=Punica granatum TaxID=22663 RepID=A0A218WDH7_PUNGR|nr:hypothetical protein CDL15_Pgr011984 [Punica granatum]PKI78590.1 hypothetical protein CRG98_000967 [Punica granatum]